MLDDSNQGVKDGNWVWLPFLAKCLAHGFIIFGPIIPFVPQYFHILKTRDTQGFSPSISFLLVLSHVLRISYWVGRPFENVLLFQSLVIILAMVLMLDLSLRIDKEDGVGGYNQNVHFLSFNPRDFWEWTDILSYVQAIVFMQAISVFAVLFLGWLPGLIDVIGLASVLFEALSVVPMLIQICQTKSTKGISKTMVFLWFLGDLFRLGFICLSTTPKPMPFVLSTLLSLLMDILIFIQILIYSGNSPAST